MNVKSGKGDLRLPAGLSAAEESQWWDEHWDYWENVKTEEVLAHLGPVRRTKPVNLRLPVDMIDALKAVAGRKSLPYQTLIRTWLKERLDAEEAAR